jgi:prepilin-type processing-associated H-X9-DG protein
MESPARGDMKCVAIPRHGSRPSRVPAEYAEAQNLPGAVNVSFYDGHVQQVKIERLWHLYWHRDYAPSDRERGATKRIY